MSRRTLVVSDLHLGSQTKHDALRDASTRAALIEAASSADRLVLLGDLLELRHGPVRDALAVAREPLSELGRALAPGTEVVIVPGNHDYQLLGDTLARRPGPLELETAVAPRRGEPLARIASWLEPASVRVAYPGVWLRPDVYATHGHYADLHLTIPTLERLAAGVMARIVALPDGGPRTIEHYEAALAPIYAWIDALAQRVAPERGGRMHGSSVRGWEALRGSGPRRRAAAAAFPVAVSALNRAGIGPLRADLSGGALRRAGLYGIDQVRRRLGITARHIVFGHTHRAGPVPGDDDAEWRTAAGARLINSGCWVHEPAFLGSAPQSSPYRIGFAVTVDDDPATAPQLVNLLG